jgi:hypothetical protein
LVLSCSSRALPLGLDGSVQRPAGDGIHHDLAESVFPVEKVYFLNRDSPFDLDQLIIIRYVLFCRITWHPLGIQGPAIWSASIFTPATAIGYGAESARLAMPPTGDGSCSRQDAHPIHISCCACVRAVP